MKRILIGLTYYYPNISGVSVYAKILAEELGKMNKVEVISAKFQKELKKKEVINKVKINRVSGWQIGKGFLMWQYPIISFIKVKNSDIVNCHLPSIESFWLALWSKILNKKLIVTYHCYFKSDSKLLNKTIEIITLPILTWANKIIVNSIDYIDGNNLLKKYQKKIVQIFPPIKVKPTRNKIRTEGKVKVGYLGRISKEKNIECLIKVFEKFPKNYRLILAGPEKVLGEKKYQNRILNLIKNNKSIVRIGEIDNPVRLFNSINCLVLPSNNPLESFGMVAAEAIVSGCPVVSSNIPGVRVPVQITGMGEICEIKDANDLAKKINLVLKNGKKYYQKRAKNLDKFDYKKTVEEYKKLFLLKN